MARAQAGMGRLVNNLQAAQENGHGPSYAAVAATPPPRSASGQMPSPGYAVSRCA